MSSENRLRPPVRGSANIQMKSRKSERLRLTNFHHSSFHDPRIHDGNLTRPPAAPLSKDAGTSEGAGDRSGANGDCGPGEGGGCKYNKNRILGLRNRETSQEFNHTLKMANTIRHVLIHTPRIHKINNSFRYKKQTRMNFTHKQRHDIITPDTCWGEPPSGEPAEPQTDDFSTALRTQSPQSQEWQRIRYRNTKRGFRNFKTVTHRKEIRKENTRNRRRDRRKTRSATSKQEWRGLAQHATTQLNRPTQPRAFQGTAKSRTYPNIHNISKTTYIRKLTKDASIPNKQKELYRRKYYKRNIKIASTNRKRDERICQKRTDHPTND